MERALTEVYGGVFDSAVLDVVLGDETLQGVDGSLHPVDGEKRGQVGSVGGRDDEGEEPPERAQNARTARPGVQISSYTHKT